MVKCKQFFTKNPVLNMADAICLIRRSVNDHFLASLVVLPSQIETLIQDVGIQDCQKMVAYR